MTTHVPSKVLSLFVASVALVIATPQARADFALGQAANFAVLYEGTGGHNFQLSSDSSITGNVGIGGTGKVQLSSGTITGNLEFSATPGSCTSNATCGGTVTGTISGGNAAVTSALTTVNNLSSTLGADSGKNVAINTSSANQTITINPGTTCTSDGLGDCVFNVTSISSNNGYTLTIDGNGTGLNAVFNFLGSSNVQFNSAIALTGGLTSSSVLFNFTGTENIQGAADGATIDGIILAPSAKLGNFSETHIDGQVFGGGSNDMQIQSNASVSYTTVPEPTSLLLLSLNVALIGTRFRHRFSRGD